MATDERGGPNGPYWRGVRELDDVIALLLDIVDWNEALLMLLRQHAGPEWTGHALEKTLEVRKAARKAKQKLVASHPRRRDDL